MSLKFCIMQDSNLEVQGLKKPFGEGQKAVLYPQRPTPYSRILFGLTSVINSSFKKNLLNRSKLQFIITKRKVRL